MDKDILLECRIVTLIVDDDPVLCEMFRAMLKHAGYSNFEVFTNVMDFKAAFKADTAIVMIDYSMPGTNGVELFKWCREINPAVYGIMATAQKDPKVIEELLNLGLNNYVSKDGLWHPIMLDCLMKAQIEVAENLIKKLKEADKKRETEELLAFIEEIRAKYDTPAGHSDGNTGADGMGQV